MPNRKLTNEGRSFNLYLDKESIAALRSIAARRGMSMSRTVRDMLREALDSEGNEKTKEDTQHDAAL